MTAVLPPGLLAGDKDSPAPEPSPLSKFGLAGLSALVKPEDNPQASYAIGLSVALMGLDLESETPVLRTLASPWQETTRLEVEPSFRLDECLLQKNIVPPPEPCDAKILSFMDETLFYIFYTKPRDTIQEYAARELVARNWRYHRDIQVWLTKDSNVEPVLISPDVERGVYVFFDPHNWVKIRKEFVLHYSLVQA